MAMAFPARGSTGLLLGILILADLFAAGYYRRHANWSRIVRLLPITFIGIVAGYYGLKFVNDQQLRPIIGAIVLTMLVVNFWRTRRDNTESAVSNNWQFIITMGLLAGVSTMMANAAGPVMIIYLLAMRLDKTEFIGTRAWFFFLVNWIKVPFSANLELMTIETIKLDLLMLPFIAAGAIAGIFILKLIPQKAFRTIVQILAATAAVKLLF